MKELNPYLKLFYNEVTPNLTKSFATVVSCTLSDVDEFEISRGKTIVDMSADEFEHIREGWFHMAHTKNESRKLRYTVEYLIWCNNNIGVVNELDKKLSFLGDTKSYYEYQKTHYWGLFLKDFDKLYSVANRSYIDKVPENKRDKITADVVVVGMIICYSSGLWNEGGKY